MRRPAAEEVVEILKASRGRAFVLFTSHQQMNEVYGRYFAANPPARSTVEAARLPRDVRVEIDAIAIVG